MTRRAVVLATFVLCACGKTNAVAIEELKPQFSVVRKTLAALTMHLADPSAEVHRERGQRLPHDGDDSHAGTGGRPRRRNAAR